MANKRISDLPVVTSTTTGDVVAIDGTTTRKVTVENLLGDNVQAIKGLTSDADKGIQFTGAGTAATYDLTAAGKALLDDADVAAQRTTLGLVIGTDVQAYDADLDAWSGKTAPSGTVVGTTDTQTLSNKTLTAPVLGSATATSVNKVAFTQPASGATLTIADGKTLTASDDATVSGTNTGDQTITLTGDITGTGTGSFATTIGATKVTSSMLNSNVFSTAHSWSGVQTFTNPIVGTQTAGDNSTKAASTAYVDAAVTAGTAGVSSIAGNTGAFTLSRGVTNVTNDIRIDPAWFRGYISGLTLSNNVTDATNDIDIAAGAANDSTDADRLVLSSGLTKRADAAWAAGTGNGGRFHATLVNGTLHYYLIKNPTTGVVDVGCSDNATDPTGGTNYPSGFTLYRRILSIPRESGSIIGFKQDGDVVQRAVPTTTTAVDPGTSAVLQTLSVPTGISVGVLLALSFALSASGSGTYCAIVTDPNLPAVTPANNNADLILATTGTAVFRASGTAAVMSNTSAQVRYQCDVSNAGLVLNLTVRAWHDSRGQR